MQQENVIIIGAGPCGLSAAIALKQIGLNPLVLEKESIVNSIYLYPTYMQFFSTPELLEIGDIPFTTANEKPNRAEALSYYRKAAKHHELRIHSYEEVTQVQPLSPGFEIVSQTHTGLINHYRASYVILATGYFDNPNQLGIPGEELSKVSHFFREAHPYIGTNVAIIGGSNSAIDAAMELARVDSKVTVVYRQADYSPSIKSWVLPSFRSLVDKGRVKMLFQSQVTRITPASIEVTHLSDGVTELANDFVLALTGFKPNRKFLSNIGVEVDLATEKPIINPDTMETNIPGLYIAGVIASGSNANEVFIESGRFHGNLIAQDLIAKQQ
jgi:thioredoxin reductase (NADPH)